MIVNILKGFYKMRNIKIYKFIFIKICKFYKNLLIYFWGATYKKLIENFIKIGQQENVP